VVECSSVVATRALLLSSDHAAVLSRRQVETEIALGLLKVMGPPLTGSWRTIGVATRRGFRPTRLTATLLDRLRTQERAEA
jgi:LysR family transcriptional regulator of gallate degradation